MSVARAAGVGSSLGKSKAPAVLYIVRHGDRYDREVGGWNGGTQFWEDAAVHPSINSHDPPLSAVGQLQVCVSPRVPGMVCLCDTCLRIHSNSSLLSHPGLEIS